MKNLKLVLLVKMIVPLLYIWLSCNEMLAQQPVKFNYDSITINVDKIYALVIFSDVKGALKILDTSTIKNHSDKVFKNEFENRFKYGYDKTNYFEKKDTTLNPIHRIFQDYWRKSLINPKADTIYEKDFLKKLFVFLKNENSKIKFTKQEVTLNNIAWIYKSYIEFKGYQCQIELRKSDGKYNFVVWKTETDTVYTVPLINDTVKVVVGFVDNFVCFGWNEYATFNRTHIGGWASSDTIWCVNESYDKKSENFIVHYLTHESQHVSDIKLLPGLPTSDLEYRAKLVQLYFGKNDIYNWIYYFINHINLDENASAHSISNYYLIRDMSKLVFNKEMESDMQKWKSIPVSEINSAAKKIFLANTEDLKNKLNVGTTFCLNDTKSKIYGHNNDNFLKTGFVTINRIGQEKTVFNAPPCIPATWVSKYGSITFNQIEIDMPIEGMNEKGLVIILSELGNSQYPAGNDKPSVNPYQWAQYQLDNSATLDEVIENNKKVKIERADLIPQHFYVCDSLGNIGIFEYLNGQLSVYKGASLIFPILCNDNYKRSMENLKAYKEFGGKKKIPEKSNTFQELIAKIGEKVKNYNPKKSNAIDYGFNLLNEVSSPTRTQWSTIYDIKNKKIYFKSSQNMETRILSMNDFNFSCKSKIKLLDIYTSNAKGKIANQFFDFSTDYYRNYQTNINKEVKDNFPDYPGLPAEIFEMIVNYPLTSKCIDK